MIVAGSPDRGHVGVGREIEREGHGIVLVVDQTAGRDSTDYAASRHRTGRARAPCPGRTRRSGTWNRRPGDRGSDRSQAWPMPVELLLIWSGSDSRWKKNSNAWAGIARPDGARRLAGKLSPVALAKLSLPMPARGVGLEPPAPAPGVAGSGPAGPARAPPRGSCRAPRASGSARWWTMITWPRWRSEW